MKRASAIIATCLATVAGLLGGFAPAPASATDTAFISTWKTDNPGSASDTVVLPLADGTFGGVTNLYNFNADWGDGSSSTVTAAAEGTHTYDEPGTYTITITGTIKGFAFRNSGDRDKLLDISQWGPLSFGNTGGAFWGASNFNSTATDSPDLTDVTDLSSTFRSATSFNGDIGNWQTGNVTNMGVMFYGASVFNQDISEWDTGQVTDFSGTFWAASRFDQPVGEWDTGSAEAMDLMFGEATDFNHYIGDWDVEEVDSTAEMFYKATSFNQDLSEWKIDSLSSTDSMFFEASAFNQDIGEWDTSGVSNMKSMFALATAFNQDLSTWNVTGLDGSSDPEDPSWAAYEMFYGTALSTGNYDSILVSWASQDVEEHIIFGAQGVKYSAGPPTTSRTSLINSKQWQISDSGQSPYPGKPTSVTATGGDEEITATWTAAPIPGSDAVLDYTATAYQPNGDSAGSCTTASLSCTIDDLAYDEYTVSVTARNTAGTGPASAPSETVTPDQVAPANQTQPHITGTARNLATLTADPGTWTGGPAPDFSYQWQSCVASDCTGTVTDIGTDADSFALTADQIGLYIRVRVTGTNDAGSDTANSPTTTAVLPLPGITPELSVATATSTGYVFTVNNYDPGFAWDVVSSAGAVSLQATGSTLTATVSGLSPSSSATTTVTTTRTGYATESATVSGTASAAATTPTLALEVPTGELVVGQRARVVAILSDGSASVKSAAPTKRSATGTVTVTLNGRFGCSATPDAAGRAVCNVTIRTSGKQRFAASFSGTINGQAYTAATPSTESIRAATVSITHTRSTIVASCRTKLTVRGRTTAKSEQVTLQQRVGSKWRTLKVVKSKTGKWVAVLYPQQKKLVLRARDKKTASAAKTIRLSAARGDCSTV